MGELPDRRGGAYLPDSRSHSGRERGLRGAEGRLWAYKNASVFPQVRGEILVGAAGFEPTTSGV